MLKELLTILENLQKEEERLLEFINREGGLEIQKEWHKENLEKVRNEMWDVMAEIERLQNQVVECYNCGENEYINIVDGQCLNCGSFQTNVGEIKCSKRFKLVGGICGGKWITGLVRTKDNTVVAKGY